MSHSVFSYRLMEDLPPLAWIAAVKKGIPEVLVVHGQHVETFDNFFVEGVWAGDFAPGGISEAASIFGSGGEIAPGKLCFVSSTATTEFIYWYVRGSEIFVSNSLPSLLGYVDDRLEPKCTEYAEINNSLVRGINAYRREIPTTKGTVYRLLHFNLEIRDDKPTIVEKPLPPHFSNFGSYYDYLASSLRSCIANARSPARRTPMHIYSTQSKGYDTTAINSIVHAFGIDGVFTIPHGKANDRFADRDAFHQPDDDGTAICNLLNLPTILLNRREFESGVPIELYYWAGMHRCGDMNLCGVAKHIAAPALLLTGNFGEIWYTRMHSTARAVSDELIPSGIGGWGLSEVRLKIGYVHLSAPFIGARRRSEILEISESEEMAPWRLGVVYDRPIPRRIAETGGVPRAMFGQEKIASVVDFPTPNIPFDEELRRAYFKFLESNGLLSAWMLHLLPIVHAYNSFASYRGASQNIAAYRLDRVIRRITRGKRRLGNVWRHLDGSVYCFAVNRLASSLPNEAARGIGQSAAELIEAV